MNMRNKEPCGKTRRATALAGAQAFANEKTPHCNMLGTNMLTQADTGLRANCDE